MSRAAPFLAILSVAILSASCSEQGKELLSRKLAVGRKLQDISITTTQSSFTLTAFGSSSGTPNGNCYIQGYPGSRADSVSSGPLTVTVSVNNPLTIYFSHGSDSYFQNYNYSGSVNQTAVSQNSSYGLISVTFSPTSAGQTVNVFSGLISGNAPITQPTCLVNVTIVAVGPPPPPPPSVPSLGGACTGVIPCYCQNGYCFNNGAQLSNNCAPPGGQSCTPVTVNPANLGIQYAYNYPSSVNVCQCTSTSG